jgi:hypothetical protein
MLTPNAATRLIPNLADAYELIADELPAAVDQSAATAATIAECVPLLAIAMELIDRGPAALTIEGVESYRLRVMRLLEHIQPAVKREANLTLANWTSQLLAA